METLKGDLRLDSYVSKEELLTILNNLDFKAVNSLHLEAITGFLINCDPDNQREQEIKKIIF